MNVTLRLQPAGGTRERRFWGPEDGADHHLRVFNCSWKRLELGINAAMTSLKGFKKKKKSQENIFVNVFLW